MVRIKLLVMLAFLVGWVFCFKAPIRAEGDLEAQKKEIEELQRKLEEIKNQKQSLAQTIQYITAKTQITQKEIAKTEAEISLIEKQVKVLIEKIGVLDINLGKLSTVMVNRVRQSYKNKTTEPIMLLFSANGLNDFLRKYKYLQVSQLHDRQVIFSLEEARVNYDQQKQIKEAKQREVETLKQKLVNQKTLLDRQQKEKQAALAVTKNDEKKYQEQLAKALAELSAIQSIIAGRGSETQIGKVNEGEKIASVIVGASACSSGTHLHFEVAKNGNHLDPASYLSPKDVFWDNAPDGSFGFSGSWQWPVEAPVRITQGYGMTFYAGTLRYYGGAPHTGIDMLNNEGNMNVKAVREGTLFRGAIGCGKGNLRYVRVEQGDGISTYYLHINY